MKETKMQKIDRLYGKEKIKGTGICEEHGRVMLHTEPCKECRKRNGVNPTHQHDMTCGKLFGRECNCNAMKIIEKWENDFNNKFGDLLVKLDNVYGNENNKLEVSLKSFIAFLLNEKGNNSYSQGYLDGAYHSRNRIQDFIDELNGAK